MPKVLVNITLELMITVEPTELNWPEIIRTLRDRQRLVHLM